MSTTRRLDDEPAPSARLRAAAWVARLHDGSRSPAVEARLRRWLGESEDHRRAFARLSRAWEVAGSIRLRARRGARADRWRKSSRVIPWVATVAVTVVLAATAGIYYLGNDHILATRIGQRQIRQLLDGTRVVLNTDTRIEIDYDEHARRVRLIRGEARFDVSKHPAWPFLVNVDGQEIRALGTSFIVRLDGTERLSVTLVEGRITVAPLVRVAPVPGQDPQVLLPGQRLILTRHHAPAVDRPDLARLTAWQQGRVVFDALPLAEAAAEMNRYSKTHITIADAEVAQLRIGGVFHAGDSEEFVRVATVALGLRAEQRGDTTVLSGAAAPASGGVP